jgi:hypothetical protein
MELAAKLDAGVLDKQFEPFLDCMVQETKQFLTLHMSLAGQFKQVIAVSQVAQDLDGEGSNEKPDGADLLRVLKSDWFERVTRMISSRSCIEHCTTIRNHVKSIAGSVFLSAVSDVSIAAVDLLRSQQLAPRAQSDIEDALHTINELSNLVDEEVPPAQPVWSAILHLHVVLPELLGDTAVVTESLVDAAQVHVRSAREVLTNDAQMNSLATLSSTPVDVLASDFKACVARVQDAIAAFRDQKATALTERLAGRTARAEELLRELGAPPGPTIDDDRPFYDMMNAGKGAECVAAQKELKAVLDGLEAADLVAKINEKIKALQNLLFFFAILSNLYHPALQKKKTGDTTSNQNDSCTTGFVLTQVTGDAA